MRTAVLVVVLSAAAVSIATDPLSRAASCDVVDDFGAVGDNRTEDTAAVQAALRSCKKVVLRAGHTFLLRPIELLSHNHLEINGNVAAWREIETWPNSTNKLCSETSYMTPPDQAVLVPQKEALLWGAPPLLNVTISGQGTVDGQGWRWWPLKQNTSHGEYWHNCRPHLLFLGLRNVTTYGAVQDVHISGVTFKDSPFWTLTGRGLRRVTFSNVKVHTTGCGYFEAPNTDGFNLQGEDLLVEDSSVRNGDDCVPLFPPTRNVLVRNMTCSCGNPPVVLIWPAANYPLTPPPFVVGNVENVHFDRFTLKGTSGGLALKSLSPFVGHAHNISFTNFHLESVQIGLAINFFHQGFGGTYVDNSVPGQRFGATASSVLVENITGTVAMNAGHIDCLGNKPCDNFRLENLNLTSVNGSALEGLSCMNASGVAKNCEPKVDCLQ